MRRLREDHRDNPRPVRELLVRKATRPTLRRPPEPRSWRPSLANAAFDLAWFFPGAAFTLIALLVGGDEVLVVIGVLLLLSGGVLKFGDFTPW
jgi:hypothetical protein